jgi:hypothetical protein
MALLVSADPDLSTLGPVGFFLVHRVGAVALYVLGLVWPVCVGFVSWGVAARSFCRRDVV